MGQYVPEHILIAEVLHRLPVKSLMRFRCVSKTWHHVIGSSSFINTHLKYQKDSLEKYMLYENDPLSLCSLLTNRDSIFDLLEISKRYPTPDMSWGWRRIQINYLMRGGLRVYGICNGLLCFSLISYRIGDDIHLWNPTCYKTKKLPEIHIDIDIDIDISMASVSFGYYNEDHKVIVMAPIADSYIVFVYSLSSNTWNTIRPDFHHHIPFYINGNINDYDASPIKYTGVVVSTVYMIEFQVACFDLSDETFRLIDLPEELFNSDVFFSSITVEAYGETIAIFGCDYYYPGACSMWILKNRPSSTSTSLWEKKFVFGLLEAGPLRGVGFLNNGKYLVRTIFWDEEARVKFFVCDLEFQNLSELRSVDAYNFSGRIHSNYVESLLLLDEDGLILPSYSYYGGDRKKLFSEQRKNFLAMRKKLKILFHPQL